MLVHIFHGLRICSNLFPYFPFTNPRWTTVRDFSPPGRCWWLGLGGVSLGAGAQDRRPFWGRSHPSYPKEYEGFLKNGYPIAGWFLLGKIPSRNGWWLAVPPFQETPIWRYPPKKNGWRIWGHMNGKIPKYGRTDVPPKNAIHKWMIFAYFFWGFHLLWGTPILGNRHTHTHIYIYIHINIHRCTYIHIYI